MVLSRRAWAAFLAVVLLAIGCGDDGGEQEGPGGRSTTKQEPSNGGDGALGGNAMVGTLARAPVESPPPGDAAWNAWRVELEPGEKVEHEHPFSTVYAEQGAHTLTVGSEEEEVDAEGGAIVGAGQVHVHEATDERSVFWDVLLAEPGAELPGAQGAERVFETEPLDGVPDQAEVAFLDVVLPPGGQTTVHTHPGPETIYVTNGPFDYQNGIEGTTTVDAGDLKSIPPDTPVQKRNPGDGKPRFLSWFVVDPAKEFAPPAEFDSSG